MFVSSSIENGGCVAAVTREQRKCGEDDKAGLGWAGPGASINNNNLVLDPGYPDIQLQPATAQLILVQW